MYLEINPFFVFGKKNSDDNCDNILNNFRISANICISIQMFVKTL